MRVGSRSICSNPARCQFAADTRSLPALPQRSQPTAAHSCESREHLAASHNIGHRKASSRLEDSESFSQNAVFVCGEIDDAVGNNHVNGVVGQRNVLNLALQELDVLNARLCACSRSPEPAFHPSCRGRMLCPSGRPACAESRTSMPPPEPRSRTISPGFSLANAVGFPQPSEASRASSGIWPACAAS